MELFLRLDKIVQLAICEVDRVIIYDEVPIENAMKYLYSNLFGMSMDTVYVFTHGSLCFESEPAGLRVLRQEVVSGEKRVQCSVFEADENVSNIYYLCYLLTFDKIVFIDELNLDLLVEGVVCHRVYGDGYLVSFRSDTDLFLEYVPAEHLSSKLAEFTVKFNPPIGSGFCDLDHFSISDGINSVFSNAKECFSILEEDNPAEAPLLCSRLAHFLTECLLVGVMESIGNPELTYVVYGDEREPNFVQFAMDYNAYVKASFDSEGNPLFADPEPVVEQESAQGELEPGDFVEGLGEFAGEQESEFGGFGGEPDLGEQGLESGFSEEPGEFAGEQGVDGFDDGFADGAAEDDGFDSPLDYSEVQSEGQLGEEVVDLSPVPKNKSLLKIILILLGISVVIAIIVSIAFNSFAKRDKVALQNGIAERQVELEDLQEIYNHYESYAPNASELINTGVLSTILNQSFPGYLGEISLSEGMTNVVVYLTSPKNLKETKKAFDVLGECSVKDEGSVALTNGVLYKYSITV